MINLGLGIRSENFKNTPQAMHRLILLCLINLIAICEAPEVTFKLGYYCFKLNIKLLTH